MLKITLAEELLHLSGGQPELSFDSPLTVKELLLQLFCRCPQLYVFLMDNQAAEASRVMLILNDSELLEYDDLPRVLGPDDGIHLFYGIPAGEYGATVGYLASFVGTAVATAVVNTVIQVVVSYVVSVVISAIMGALTDDVATPESTIASNSATYTFDGVKNTTASGTPLGIVYGQHRVGGQILSLFTQHPADNQTNLLYQIGLGEGPMDSISEIEINKLPQSYFHGVAPLEKRYGTSDQTAMDDFSMIETSTSIQRKALNLRSSFTPSVRTDVASVEPVYGIVQRKKLKLGPYKWVTTESYYDETAG